MTSRHAPIVKPISPTNLDCCSPCGNRTARLFSRRAVCYASYIRMRSPLLIPRPPLQASKPRTRPRPPKHRDRAPAAPRDLSTPPNDEVARCCSSLLPRPDKTHTSKPITTQRISPAAGFLCWRVTPAPEPEAATTNPPQQ